MEKVRANAGSKKNSPTFGTGKPERLRGNLNGFWSREITKKDRLIYRIEDSEVIVFVISLKGHYGDK